MRGLSGMTRQALQPVSRGLPISLFEAYLDGRASPVTVRNVATSLLTRQAPTAALAITLLEEMEFLDRARQGAAPRGWMYIKAITIGRRQGDLESTRRAVEAVIERGLLPEWVKDIDLGLLAKHRSNLTAAVEYLEGEKSGRDLLNMTAAMLKTAGPESSVVCLAALKWARQQLPGFDISLYFYAVVIGTCEKASCTQEAAQVRHELVEQGLLPPADCVPHFVPWQKSIFNAGVRYLEGEIEAHELLAITARYLMDFHRLDADAAQNQLSALAWFDGKKPGVKPEPQMYHRTIVAHGREGNADEVLALHAHMLAQGLAVDPKTVNAVIWGCAKAAQKEAHRCAAGAVGDPEKISEYAHAAMKLGTYDRNDLVGKISACHFAAAVWAASEHPDKKERALAHADDALRLLPSRESSERSSPMVTSAIAACAKAAAAGSPLHAAQALQIYDEANADGVPLSYTALSAVLAAVVDSGDDRFRSRAVELIHAEKRLGGLINPLVGQDFHAGRRVFDFHVKNIFTGKNDEEFFDKTRMLGVQSQTAIAVLDYHAYQDNLKCEPRGDTLSFGTGEGRVRRTIVQWLHDHNLVPVDVLSIEGHVKPNLLRFARRDR